MNFINILRNSPPRKQKTCPDNRLAYFKGNSTKLLGRSVRKKFRCGCSELSRLILKSRECEKPGLIQLSQAVSAARISFGRIKIVVSSGGRHGDGPIAPYCLAFALLKLRKLFGVKP